MVQPLSSFQKDIGNTFSKQSITTFAKRVAADTATTTLATAVCTSFNPAAGLIIGAVSRPTTRFINWVCDQLHVGENSIIAKTSSRVLSTITGIALGTMLAQAAGIQITFIGACVISLSTYGLCAFASAVGIGSVVLSVLVAQAILKGMPRNGENTVDSQARAAVEHFHTTANDILHNRIGIDRHIQKAHDDFNQLINECRQMLGLEAIEPEAELLHAE
jgi:hypothetical protein